MIHTNTPFRGYYIAVEGIDGSGKSTFVRLLAQKLQQDQYEVVLTKEPGGTPIGKAIREILSHPVEPLEPRAEFLLFAADRAHNIETLVKPACARGAVVISDRTGDSSLAYQGYGRGVDRAMIQTINAWATDAVRPHIIFYLRVSPAVARQRMAQRNERVTSFEQEQDAFFARVIAGFDAMYRDADNVITLDAEQSIETVFQKGLQALNKHAEL